MTIARALAGAVSGPRAAAPAPALAPAGRSTEATVEQLVATGAYGAWGQDPVDGDVGYRPLGAPARAVPWWTLEKARAYSIAAYRSNPMARAIIDTYTAFCVGDSGVGWQATNGDVREVVEEFWTDPRNRVGDLQDAMLRDHLLNGETLLEMLVGPSSGVTRFSPVNPAAVTDVELDRGNPLWPSQVVFRAAGEETRWSVALVDDATGLRTGRAQWWTSGTAVLTDRRGTPFLMSVLDWLDNYESVLSNLIDRTALARYLVWDVTVKGGQTEIDDFVRARGGTHIPRSGSVEVHNDAVSWEPKQAESGAYEDTAAAGSILTSVAGGAGLAKTWLAEPENSNRATSLTMAEPVRRRVGGVQKRWLANVAELARFAVDQAVAARRLPALVDSTDPKTGETRQVRAAATVSVTGPEIAASDAQINALMLMNLSKGLQQLVATGALSKPAAKIAASKAWEQFVGVPYTADLDTPDANPDDVATAVDDGKNKLRAVQPA